MAQSIRPLIFGKYCLLERVSVGGMAEVFRARPFNAPNFRRFLAVKRILPNLAEDEEFISMFVDEAKIAVQLNHRNVCQIYELGRLNGSYYIVMEYIPGKNLLQMQNRFRQEKRIMSVTQAAFLISRICDGLDYSHRKTSDDGRPLSIIHRDVSPQNVLVSYEGEVKVIDFGIARAATRNEQTQVGVLKGKFGYMSPEQANGEDVDRRSDVFAVGTLMWEMLTARRLFHGEGDYATLELVRSCKIEPPSSKNSRVPPEIDAIVMKALAANRDERYQWASEMGEDLREFLAALKPPYTERTLAQWMGSSWRDEVESECGKFEQFARFVSTDDVIKFLDEDVEELTELIEEDDLQSDDGDEATRVFQAGGPEKGSLGPGGDVLAENDEEPIATVVMREDDVAAFKISVDDDAEAGAPTPLPQSTRETSSPARLEQRGQLAERLRGAVSASVEADVLAEESFSQREARATFDAPAVRFESRKRAMPAALALFVVVLVLGALGAVGYLYYVNRPDPMARLEIEVTPSEGVQVFLNSQALAGVSPFIVEDVPPGTAYVELRREGYLTVLEPVELTAGASMRFVRTLTPAATDGRVALDLSDPLAQVYLNGSLVGGQGARRTFSASARTPHVVEVYRPGHFVETWEFTLDGGAEFARTANLRPVSGSIRIDPEPDGLVLIDGVERGATGEVSVDGLDVRRPWTIEIRPSSPGYVPMTTTTVFDTYYDIRMQPRLRRIGETGSDDAAEFGWLTTGEAESWMRVLVDGRDTGLITPIAPDGEIPGLALKVGTRRVTFSRAGQERTVEVVIAAGQNVHVVPPPAP